MKRILLLCAIAFSVGAKAQVDPAFTAKMINHVTAVMDWYDAGQPESGESSDAIASTFSAFYPTSVNGFTSKIQAMLGSQSEMAKFTSPVSFVQCLAAEAIQFTNCMRGSFGLQDEITNLPGPTLLYHCQGNYKAGIILCAIDHLTH